jgi:hypothetical protein
VRLQQGFATGEMGFNRHFAQQQALNPDVRKGSQADMPWSNRDVRFTPAGSTDRRNTF